MPKRSLSIKKSSLNAVEQYELNQWLEENQINASNLRRSFTDVLPLARLLSRYYPEIIDLNYYPPRNSIQNKLCNWESFNKRVLAKLGLQLNREQMVRVARSVPGSVDLLLYSVMRVHQAAEKKAREERPSTEEEEDEDVEEEQSAAPAATATPAGAATATTPASPAAASAAEIGLKAPPPKPMTMINLPLVISKHSKESTRPAKSQKQTLSSTATAASALKRARGSGTGTGSASPLRAGSTQRTGRQKRQAQGAAAAAATPAAAAATTTRTSSASKQRGEQLSELPQPQPTVLYSIYMQAVTELQQKNARIARFDQWSAHLESMLQMKCEQVDELQRQVALATTRAPRIRKLACPTRTTRQGRARLKKRGFKPAMKVT